MKKILLCTGAAALMLGAASCSSEIDEPGITGDGNVHFTVKLPEQMRTRAISDGTTASTLTYAVYDKATDELVTLSEDQVSFDPTTLTATVDLRLVNGKSYELLFWADAPGNAFYKFVPGSKSIEVDYTGLTNSDESRDAFFASRVFDVTGPINETVELRRPFAQVNLGTDDMTTDAVQKAYAAGMGVSLSTTAYGTLNLSDGTVDDEQTVIFANALATLTSGETFPYNPNPSQNNPYTWISMDYILTSSEKQVIDTEFTFWNGTVANTQTLPVSNVPVQRNYRTNIYGSLLTSPANLQIVIVPGYEEDDYLMEIWDGVTATSPVIDDVAKTVTVNLPSQLAGLAKLVNGGNTFDGYTVTLADDLDLAGHPWTPIGDIARSSSTGGFSGTFDGAGHQIMNLNVTATGDNYGAGLFSVVRGGTVKNVEIVGGSVSSEDYAGAIVGVTLAGGTIENCINNGVAINAGQAAGGIVGRLYGQSDKVSGCTNSGAVSGAKKVGSIAGITSIGGAEISGCTNTGDLTGGMDGIGGILGYVGKGGSVTNCDNQGNVGTGNERYAGGIVGYHQSQEVLSIGHCSNSGAVKGQNAGGIFGALGQYQQTDISYCTNSGAVTGVMIAGGISAALGSGTVSDCDNTAAVTATASNSVAGGVIGRMATATLVNCHGGSAAITATYAGRQVGNVTTGNDPKMATITIPAGDGYADGLVSVGTMGNQGATAISNLTVAGGELIGAPDKQTASGVTITIAEGASWSEFPGQTGRWTFRNGVWTK